MNFDLKFLITETRKHKDNEQSCVKTKVNALSHAPSDSMRGHLHVFCNHVVNYCVIKLVMIILEYIGG